VETRYVAILLGAIVALFLASASAQTGLRSTAGQSLPVAASTQSASELLDGGSKAWSQIPVKRVALNRTPPLYDTDEPARPEINAVDVRLLRAGGKLFVQLSWGDATRDATTLEAVPDTRPETRFHKVPTEADERFFDAAAVMFPAATKSGATAPSLQMGDAEHSVQIYYWNATRGAMVMQAQGRGTTRRTGQDFPAKGDYRNGRWTTTFELPDLAAGTTVSFAIWNGSQKDRDGRKYFSTWQVVE
jgi:hypothetical protein